MAAATVSAVSIAGSLQNLLSSGWNAPDSVKELVDDSLGAEAKSFTMVLKPETKTAEFADKGWGMDASRLATSHQLNTRSDVSERKHGRFGIGRSAALSLLSQNKGSAKTISLADASNLKKNLVECTLDLAGAVQTNQLPINAHAASMMSHDEWAAHFGTEATTGTITSVQCEEGIFAELQDMVQTPDFTKSLPFDLGRTYAAAINAGCAMSVQLDEERRAIPAIDMLAWDSIAPASKTTVELEVYRHTQFKQQFRVYYTHDGKRVYREMNRDTGRMKMFKDAPDAKWRKVGGCTFRAAHSRDWVSLLAPKFEALGLPIPDGSSHEVMEALGGIQIVRNGRVIFRVPVTMPTTGDFGERKDVVNTHVSVEFAATEFLDDAFGIMTNKNRIIWLNVLKALRDTIEDLHQGFAKEMYKVAKRSVTPPPVVPAPEPSDGAEQPTPPVELPVAPAQPTVPIQPHGRLAARSEQDLVRRVLQFQEQLDGVELEELLRAASNSPRGGIAKLIVALDDVIGELNKIPPPS